MGVIADTGARLGLEHARSRVSRLFSRDAATVGSLVPLASVATDGLMVLADGTLVRGFAVQPLNALVFDEEAVEQLSGQAHKLLARIPVGQTLSFYVDSTPLDAARLASEQEHASATVARALAARGERELAQATSRLARAQSHSLLTHVPALPVSRTSYLVLVPFRPDGKATMRRGRDVTSFTADAFAAARAEHDRYVAAVHSGLQAMRLAARPLESRELVGLLWERCAPTRASRGEPIPAEAQLASSLGTSVEQAHSDTAGLLDALCEEPLDLSSRSQMRWGGTVEQVVRLAGVPEETWLGWTQYLTLAGLPFTLAVHVHGRDRYREKSRQKRRYRQLWAANRGQERMGKLVDPDREDAELEAREVTAALKRQAAAGVYDLSAYLAMREPSGNKERLREELRAVSRELTSATDATTNDGLFAQAKLWPGTLPLGIDPARRGRKYLSVNAADSFPLIGSGGGSPASPTAIPLGYAHPTRELVWIDPFDPLHLNHVTVLAGSSGGGKTMLVNILLGRAAAKGARGWIIDRSGHYDFAAATVPGSAIVRIGDGVGEQRINPWDGEASAEKVGFLVALHELLLGNEQGLGKLEQNLLGLAIRAVYRRCQETGETPRERLLQEELTRRHLDAKTDGSPELAAAYQLLGESLHNYVGDGPYAWLCDQETTVEPDAPLVVYDTRRLPDSEAPAALLVICEQIIRRVETAREAYLAGNPDPALPWAGRSYLICEEVWKLVTGAPATGRWVNELARRSRHLALWLIAISQQLDDFHGPHAEALISQSTIRLILKQNPDQLATVRELLGRSHAAIEQIRELQTVKREYSQVYVINGGRGEGTVTIAVSDYEYWRSTSDPIGDEPLRRLAMRHAADSSWHGAWSALRILADPAWHHEHTGDRAGGR
jgi:hypothetical protein